MFYAKTTGGFYIPEIHGENIPDDAVEITDDEHRALLAAQAQGKIIQSDENGRPVASERPAPTVESLAESVRKIRDCRMLCALDANGKYQTQQALIASGGTVANAMTEQDHVAVLQYIEDLRNIPQQSGFPWNGPDDVACPWPTKPSCVCDQSIA